MTRARTFPATVDHEGVIQFDPVLRRAFRRHVLKLSGERVEVTVKKRHPSWVRTDTMPDGNPTHGRL